MSATDDLATLQANNAADAAALTSLEADLTTPATESVGDQFLTNATSFLTGLGYTVTPPASDATDDSTESPTEDTTETPADEPAV